MKVIDKKVGESFEIALDNRGSAGLSMLYKLDAEDIVSVDRLESLKTDTIKPGDPVKAIFKIQAQKKGRVKIIFYETQIWNKDFEHLPVMELTVNVE